MEKHEAFGKMIEVPSTWGDVKHHPAFKNYRKTGPARSRMSERMDPNSLPLPEEALNLWVGTEKIHGANMSFLADGTDVLCAKREAILHDSDEENTSFFGYLAVKKQYETAAATLFAALKADNPSLTKVTVYGELFGGSYPHKDVPVATNLTTGEPYQPVQEGVYYSPALDYAAYDVRLHTADNAKGDIMMFSEARRQLQAAGFKVAPQIRAWGFDGESFTDAAPFPSRVASAFYGLPPIEGNVAEGIVWKTNVPQVVGAKNGRTIFKTKIAAFREVMEVKAKAINAETPEAKAKAALQFVKRNMLNPNVLNSARSKAGRGAKASAAVVGYVMADVKEALDEVQLPVTDEVETVVAAWVDENL